jgi:Transposase DDE domain
LKRVRAWHDEVLEVTKPKDHTMHAGKILTQVLGSAIALMHASRARLLLCAVEAVLQGRRLTLVDIARAWPGATWMHAPHKALDRLLSNVHLHAHLDVLRVAMLPWLLRGPCPCVIVDWSDLKGDGRWSLLRAAVAIGGRTLTVLDRIFPTKNQNSPKAQRQFLLELKRLVGDEVRLIIITDAGFRSDWFRLVQELNWDFVGRLRNNTMVQSSAHPQWRGCNSLYDIAKQAAQNLGDYQIVKGNPMSARLVIVKRAPSRRHGRTRKGAPDQGAAAKKARKRALEPWLLVTSLNSTTHRAEHIVAHYRKRMQIEEAFRDLKSNRYGVGFENSLSRKQNRLDVLLLLHTLAQFASWITSVASLSDPRQDPINARIKRHSKCSNLRLGREWLIQHTLPWRIKELTQRWFQQLQNTSQELMYQ